MDVTPGGAWRATMVLADGQEIAWHGAYQEVAEPQGLVLTLADRPGEDYKLMTVVLNDLGDGRTEMVFRQSGGHVSDEGYERLAWPTPGRSSALDRARLREEAHPAPHPVKLAGSRT